tara:strand:- start:6 stop:536 length:531 start_codon:yes stop_codon:yes gene_type:complete
MNIPKISIKFQALYLILFVVGMISLSYASVPLYKLFCQVTGYGGTPKISSENNNKKHTRIINVRFDSSTEKKSPLFFKPSQKNVKINVGENNLIFYKSKNTSREMIKGTATYNITPLHAAQYFNKIECFCFEEQTFNPGQEVEMPVSFFIDSAILDDKNMDMINELTLSYTMFVKN